MAEAWISYFGIRVTNLERSIEFYTRLLDLEVISRGGSSDSEAVQLRDRHSGQRLELNWYAPGSPYARPYVPGEGLDHIGIQVRDLLATRDRLKELGIEVATRELPSDREMWVTPEFRVLFIKDPDGNFLELFDVPAVPAK